MWRRQHSGKVTEWLRRGGSLTDTPSLLRVDFFLDFFIHLL
ncbi:hypothetical protein HSB1_45110 [Halogranum salarium B-1]|uniref:Uncharacterized protein n=1 Tax=Halogranum salarium B-1 TaxID=1210908 RepID=J2Z916_9EURY|nr:hypothetical protein HSB1_45110 [Halogranum salarium B-1]